LNRKDVWSVVEIREKKNVSSEEKRFEVKMGALRGVYIQILEFGIFTIGFCICITFQISHLCYRSTFVTLKFTKSNFIGGFNQNIGLNPGVGPINTGPSMNPGPMGPGGVINPMNQGGMPQQQSMGQVRPMVPGGMIGQRMSLNPHQNYMG
jgi:hypothetical protein